jgi:hypothetical protein
MEEIAAPNVPGTDTLNLTFFYVDADLLQEQENFFSYVEDNLNYLNYKRRQLAGNIGPRGGFEVANAAVPPRMHPPTTRGVHQHT